MRDRDTDYGTINEVDVNRVPVRGVGICTFDNKGGNVTPLTPGLFIILNGL